MLSNEFIQKLISLKPVLVSTANVQWNMDQINNWDEYVLKDIGRYKDLVVEDLNQRLNLTIRLDNFDIYCQSDYQFDDVIKENGFYAFGFYLQDYLFVNLKNGQIESRDLFLNKYYDVSKNEQCFLEAFLIFAKYYADDLKNYIPNSGAFYSMPILQRRAILTEITDVIGGEKYVSFWKQVFQAWSDEELKEMNE